MQKITPHLWFDKNAEEAMNFYISLFENSKIVSITKYPENSQEEHMKGMDGKILQGIFELEGQQFRCLDGGPEFKLNPSISFFVNCETEEEVNKFWGKLVEGGKVLMELQQYPFNDRYGWLQDRFGVSWQIILNKAEQKIRPSLMFTGDKAGKAEAAIKFYTSIFEDSEIVDMARYEAGEGDKKGYLKYAVFKLAGQEFSAMDSSAKHAFSFNEAISLYVDCADQVEVDKFWEALSAVPESEICGWIKDKFGVSWQIIPKQLGDFMSSPDKVRSGKVMHAMLQMKKIDVARLQEAYNEN